MAARMRTAVPTRKVYAGALAGAISTLLVYAFNSYVSPTRALPPEAAAAVTTVVTFVVSYFVRPAERDTVVSASVAAGAGAPAKAR